MKLQRQHRFIDKVHHLDERSGLNDAYILSYLLAIPIGKRLKNVSAGYLDRAPIRISVQTDGKHCVNHLELYHSGHVRSSNMIACPDQHDLEFLKLCLITKGLPRPRIIHFWEDFFMNQPIAL